MMKVIGYIKGVPCPLDVIDIDGRKHYLCLDAAAAFHRMQDAAIKDGYHFHVNRAFATMAEQERLYKEWKEKKRKLKPSEPGKSKHQCGVAVDITRCEGDPDGDGPMPSPLDRWFEANAAKFGFTRPNLPKEPWHLEYTGDPRASKKG